MISAFSTLVNGGKIAAEKRRLMAIYGNLPSALYK